MSKKPIYFSHDVSAASDPKLKALLKFYNSTGYGLYWRIIEVLHAEKPHKLNIDSYIFAQIADELYLDVDFVKSFVRKCVHYELFTLKENFVWSERVLRNIEQQSKVSARRAEVGSKGGQARAAALAQKSGGTTSPSQNRAALSDNTPKSNFIPIATNSQAIATNSSQAIATNDEAIASIAQANANFPQANIFTLKRIEDSSSSSSSREESKGVWGKNGDSGASPFFTDFSNLEEGGNDDSNSNGYAANGGSGAAIGTGSSVLDRVKRNRQERSTVGQGDNGGVPVFPDSWGAPRS